MERLLKDATKLTGVKYDIANLSDVYSAIHAIQGEIGITGTTAKEAEETISGSVASTKAAWDNFLNGSGTFDQFIESAKVAFSNIAEAAGELLSRIAKEIINAIPEKWMTAIKVITPTLVTLGTAIGVIWGYFKMVSIIKAVSTAFEALNTVMMANPIVLIIAAIAALVAGFIYLWNTSENFRNFWIALWEGIKFIFKSVWNAISGFFTETIPSWFNNFIAFCQGFWQGIKDIFLNTWNSIVAFFTETIPQWIQNIIDWFANLPYMIGYHIGQILASIIQFGANVWNWITVDLPEIIQGIIQWFAELPGNIWNWLCNVVTNIITWGQDMWNNAVTAVSNMIDAVVNWFAQLPRKNMGMAFKYD